MGLKVAVIGLAQSTHDDAPWSDPSWEKWGLPWDYNWSMLDRFFEMHDIRLIEGKHAKLPKDYALRLSCKPCYMQEEYYVGVRKYPLEGYFNSSISYMMALAIHEGAEEIGIWGVDMADNEEYVYQKANMEYWIGRAEGAGIKVYIPEKSSLCKFCGDGIKYYNHTPAYVGRYGWLG